MPSIDNYSRQKVCEIRKKSVQYVTSFPSFPSSSMLTSPRHPLALGVWKIIRVIRVMMALMIVLMEMMGMIGVMALMVLDWVIRVISWDGVDGC